MNPHFPGFLWQHIDDVEEPLETDLRPLFGGEGPAVETFLVVKYHFPPTQKKRLLRNGVGPASPARMLVSIVASYYLTFGLALRLGLSPDLSRTAENLKVSRRIA